MEDHDFKFDSFKYIKHEDFPEIIEKIRKKFAKAGILDLLSALDHMTNKPDKDKYLQKTRLTTIKRLIAIKLGLFDNEHGYHLIDTLPGYIEENERLIRKLNKEHIDHRHDKDKSFSSVPV